MKTFGHCSPVLNQSFDQVEVEFDGYHGALWTYMNARPRPCFNSGILQNLYDIEVNGIAKSNGKIWHQGAAQTLNYVVVASRNEEIFSLGGDLSLFQKLIREGDRAGLLEYALTCIDLLFARYTGYNHPITTISLVTGTALGGGFECALSTTVLIAEKRAKMGLPEIVFNLFPGMGAYSYLLRKVGRKTTEMLIHEGKVFSASELYNLGVVDVLAENGEGIATVQSYIEKHRRAQNGHQAMERASRSVNPISYDELKEITELWVETALRIGARDLKMIDHLVSRQTRLAQKTHSKLEPLVDAAAVV